MIGSLLKAVAGSSAPAPIVRLLAVVALLGFLAGCGSGDTSTVSPAAGASAEPFSEELLRDRIVTGVGEDFRAGTGAGPKGFGLCVRLGVRRALDKATMLRLLSVSRRPGGAAFAAQALNELAVPIGAACGGRQYVPELTSAAAALRGARMIDSRAHRLGLEYGPYIGVSCRRASHIGCDRIGFDLVLRREARMVAATIAGRPIHLVSPGPVPHAAGAVGRDWGGYLDDVGLEREGSPSRIPPTGRAPGRWGGQPPVYLPVRISITYPGGRREALDLPPVFLSPGFG